MEFNMTNLRYEMAFAVDDFLALANHDWPRAYARGDAAAALTRTINIGARDGERLVGSIRVLTDARPRSTAAKCRVLRSTGLSALTDGFRGGAAASK